LLQRGGARGEEGRGGESTSIKNLHLRSKKPMQYTKPGHPMHSIYVLEIAIAKIDVSSEVFYIADLKEMMKWCRAQQSRLNGGY
jgi:hypothetical protein